MGDVSALPVYDELGFIVPEANVSEYLKYRPIYKKRDKDLKVKWDSLIKNNGWNISIDSSDIKSIVTSI